MILFIVPLVSPEVAYSWNRACQLCERTLRSICNQTSPHFKVVVVCNQIPEINFNHPNITYLQINLPIPEITKEAKTLDRGYKAFKGLQQASSSSFSHAMIVDADDCINKHLVEFIMQNKHCDGWFIQRGYVYPEGKKIIYKTKKFYRICGSCNIIKYHLYDLQKKHIQDKDFIYQYYGGHKPILRKLAEQSILIEPLPFDGAVYTVNNGENFYNNDFNKLIVPKKAINRIKNLIYYRNVTSLIKNNFGLYQIKQHKNECFSDKAKQSNSI